MAFDKNAFAAAFLNQLTAGMEERKEKAEEYERQQREAAARNAPSETPAVAPEAAAETPLGRRFATQCHSADASACRFLALNSRWPGRLQQWKHG